MMKIKRRITQSYFDFARHKYAPVIHKIAFLVGFNETQVEELKAQGVKELLKCMICYNGSGSFITFFHGRLTGVFKHMRDAERRAGRIQAMSLDSMANVAGPDHDMDSNMVIQECLGCLNDEERNVVTELFFNDKTTREISNDCGMVPSTICRIKKRAIKKMRKKCGVGSE